MARFIVVYQTTEGGMNIEYVTANSTQEAADDVRRWEREGIIIEEVAKIMKGWK